MSKSDFTVSSPDGQVTPILKFNREQGAVLYMLQSNEQEVISLSSIRISTSLGNFMSGMKLKGYLKRKIDKIYNLPQGKVSDYRNHANEQPLVLSKKGQQLKIASWVYNNDVAYRYEIRGEGEIEFNGEISSINLPDTNPAYYGQNHPNRYGYESALDPIDGERMSNSVLSHLKDKNHFVLMGQEVTYGNYVQTHFQRSANNFTYSYPLDQEKIGPVRSTLPFQSPWRMGIIFSENPGKIVESYMVENLNPLTDTAYMIQNGTLKEWLRPGRVIWDFIAKDREKPPMWIDMVAEMGWEYYIADAGFANRWRGSNSVLNVVEYGITKRNASQSYCNSTQKRRGLVYRRDDRYISYC